MKLEEGAHSVKTLLWMLNVRISVSLGPPCGLEGRYSQSQIWNLQSSHSNAESFPLNNLQVLLLVPGGSAETLRRP